ncbi:MAG: N-acetylmuramic acid 6-phosphate etherase [Verrucomicrobia bacterium]|nr:N-acetylmuramic acid 6-phosphate etherase [Verrucomicrobiota bacterium]
MNKPLKPPASASFLGIECGGTRSVALLADAEDRLLKRIEAEAANLRLFTDAQLLRRLRFIAKAFPPPAALAIGMAGARTKTDWDRIRNAAAKVWPRIPCHATNDLETALVAGRMQTDECKRQNVDRNSRRHSSFVIRQASVLQVLVLSGTGSCCYGRNSSGTTAKVGGWGHILGDKGSGFEIGLRALKAVVYYYDRDGEWSPLGQRILRSLQLSDPEDLIGWAQSASKTEVAGLAMDVFAAWRKRDQIATDILKGASHSLAQDAIACARRLTRSASSRRRRPGRVEFILAGSVLLKQPRFAARVSDELRQRWPGAVITPLQRESVWGAVELARQVGVQASACSGVASDSGQQAKAWTPTTARDLESLKRSPTEQRNPRSMNLDKLPLSRAIALMLSEDAKITGALLNESKKIERAVRLISQAFRRGGRLFYVGAGTSGRLGVLDATECPPTFRTSPEMVQAIMAGGQTALWKSVEGAEDDREAGARAIEFRGVGRRDVVVGIAASGRTPFVWGGLEAAKRRGATTILLAFNPFLKIPRGHRPSLVITPDVGPEILTGSTRLKAGTATKLILNIFSTLAMVRLGKVVGNLMVDLNPSNVKLRDRAMRIVQELRGVDQATAKSALEKSGWVVKQAVARLATKREP